MQKEEGFSGSFSFSEKGFGNRKVAVILAGTVTSVPDPVPDLNPDPYYLLSKTRRIS
jgi:hypothetical protein